MAFRIFRAFQSGLADSADSTQIQPSHWNADISHSMASGKNLGRYNGGAGPIEELDAPILTGRIHANRTTNQTGGTGGVYNKVQFNNEVLDVNGWYDAVTNFRYLPLTAGIFLVNAAISSTSGTTGESPAIQLRKSGLVEAEGPFLGSVANSITVGVSLTAIVDLNGSTDYIEVFAYLPTGITTINGVGLRTYLSVIKLSN